MTNSISRTVTISLGNGSLKTGFNNVTARFLTSDNSLSAQVKGSLPQAIELSQLYTRWQTLYCALCARIARTGDYQRSLRSFDLTDVDDELEIEEAGITHVSQSSFDTISQELQRSLNNWLSAKEFLRIEQQIRSAIAPNEEVRLIIETQDQQIWRLPWHQWQLLQDYPQADIALSTPEYKRPQLSSSIVARNQIRILAILGNSQGIDLQAEIDFLQTIPNAEITFLPTPSRQQFNSYLWDKKGWDILFFAGHSQTEQDTGRIYINENATNNSLTIEQLEEALNAAIDRGLKLAIFNSCDGLGLGLALEKLFLPAVIVMREPVANYVAQDFFRSFLDAFVVDRLPLYPSVRQARRKLQGLEDNFPGASSLPVIFHNPAVEPPTWLQLGGTPPCPYRGLSAFHEEDAHLFFGREAVTQTLIDAVQKQSLLAVVGPSGSGKSSVVFAGLIPHLRRSVRPEWSIASFRPGHHPFEALAEAIIALTTESSVSFPASDFTSKTLDPLQNTEQTLRRQALELANKLEHHPTAVHHLVDQFLRCHPGMRLLLVVDQFEELYTLCPPEKQQRFLDAILNAVQQEPALAIALTLRADFYGYALSHRRFSDALQGAVYHLGPMSQAELQTAIEQPAAQMQVKLEKGLTDKLIEETWGYAGRLPLLEFALTELWSNQQAGSLTHQTYKKIGGVEKALANHAEVTYAQLNEVDQKRVQQIFVQLVEPGAGIEPSRRLATRDEIGEMNWSLVTRLASSRLVITNSNEATAEETVEIVHEALIRSWRRLEHWLEVDGEFRRWQEELRRSRQQWERSDREAESLLRGKGLSDAKYWCDHRQDELSAKDREFIKLSVVAQEREGRQRRRRRQFIFSGLVTGLLVALTLAGVAWWGWHTSAMNEIRALSTSSDALLSSDQPFDALLEALRAKKKLRRQIGVESDIQAKVEALLHQSMFRTTEQNRLSGHKNAVAGVAFSPNGQTIASASWDNTIKLWKRDGTLLKTLTGHSDRVNDVVFSPDGRAIASASKDTTVKLWNLDGKLLNTISGHKDTVNSVAFSPDGKIMASVSVDGELKLWDLKGKLWRTIQAHSLTWGVAFSPNGKAIATCGRDRTIKLWDLNGTLLKILTGHQDAVYGVAFSPDEKTLASASWDTTIKLWNMNDGSLIRTLSGHTNMVYRAVFSADGKFLVSASRDKTIKLWSFDGSLPKTFVGHRDHVFAVAISPDGQAIASASRDGTVRLWRRSNDLVNSLMAHSSPVREIAFSPDGQTIASASWDKTIKLWTTNGTLLRSLTGHEDRVNSIAFSPDGKAIASASTDNTVRLWRIDGTLLQTLTKHENRVNSVAFSPDGQTIASASWDKTIKLWKSDGTLLKTFPIRKSRSNRVRFSPDGQTIVSANWDKTVDLWNLNGRLLASLTRHEDEVYSVALSADNQWIASTSRDKTARIWTRDGSRLVKTLSEHQDEVSDVAFSPDSQLIATASQDGIIKLWQVDGTLLSTLNGHYEGVNSVVFSHDGKTLASASEDGAMMLWNLDKVKDSAQITRYACGWLQDYFKHGAGVEKSDRHLCD